MGVRRWHCDAGCDVLEHAFLFERVEPKYTVEACPTAYGQAFAAAVSDASHICPGGSYQRISAIALGSLRLLILAEVDACIHVDQISTEDVCQAPLHWVRSEIACLDQYAACGSFVESGLVEIKTKNERYESDIDWTSWYLQMVFPGCEHLVLGLHSKGYFRQTPEQFILDEVRMKIDEEYLKVLIGQFEQLLRIIMIGAEDCPPRLILSRQIGPRF